jgi:hypothetical protein
LLGKISCRIGFSRIHRRCYTTFVTRRLTRCKAWCATHATHPFRRARTPHREEPRCRHPQRERKVQGPRATHRGRAARVRCAANHEPAPAVAASKAKRGGGSCTQQHSGAAMHAHAANYTPHACTTLRRTVVARCVALLSQTLLAAFNQPSREWPPPDIWGAMDLWVLPLVCLDSEKAAGPPELKEETGGVKGGGWGARCERK